MAQTYTQSELRERLKKKIIAGTKGGRKGQWSARKAQLLAHEYESHGGGYRGGKKAPQKHLDAWTKEEWTTADGKPARRRKNGHDLMDRYLPKKAWSKLSASEKASTRKKKQAGDAKKKQFVGNTAKAKSARRRVTH